MGSARHEIGKAHAIWKSAAFVGRAALANRGGATRFERLQRHPLPPSCRHRPIREGQLLARAPLVRHVVDDHGLAHPFDAALFEAVKGDVGGHEHHRRVGGERRAAQVLLVLIVDVGAERPMLWVLRPVEQHREHLDAEVGVRLEPKTVRVLPIFNPQVGSRELRAEDLGNPVGDALVLEGLAERLADRKLGPVLNVEILAGGIVQFALAGNSSKVWGWEGQGQNRIDGVFGNTAPQEPMAIGLPPPTRAIYARAERGDKGVLRDRHYGPRCPSVGLRATHDANPSQQRWLSDCHAGGERSDPSTISWALGGDRTVRSGPPLPLGAPGKEARCQSPESGAPVREDPSGPAPTPYPEAFATMGRNLGSRAGCPSGRSLTKWIRGPLPLSFL